MRLVALYAKTDVIAQFGGGIYGSTHASPSLLRGTERAVAEADTTRIELSPATSSDVHRYMCRGGLPSAAGSSQRVWSHPDSARRMRIGYRVPDFSGAAAQERAPSTRLVDSVLLYQNAANQVPAMESHSGQVSLDSFTVLTPAIQPC